MIEQKTWREFQNAGMLFLCNNLLMAFGWSLVFNLDKATGMIMSCYPARVKFRGFSNDVTVKGYKLLGNYISENAEALKEEANS